MNRSAPMQTPYESINVIVSDKRRSTSSARARVRFARDACGCWSHRVDGSKDRIIVTRERMHSSPLFLVKS